MNKLTTNKLYISLLSSLVFNISGCTSFTPVEVRDSMIGVYVERGMSEQEAKHVLAIEDAIKNVYETKWSNTRNLKGLALSKEMKRASLRKNIKADKLALQSYELQKKYTKPKYIDSINMNINYIKERIRRNEAKIRTL